MLNAYFLIVNEFESRHTLMNYKFYKNVLRSVLLSSMQKTRKKNGELYSVKFLCISISVGIIKN